MGGILDRFASGEYEEQEENLGGRGFNDLPVGAWVVLRAMPGDSGAASGVEELGTDENKFYKLKLGLVAIGGDETVDASKQPYSIQFVRFGVDTKDKPGVPSGLLVGLRNAFFAPGVKDPKERSRKALEVLDASVTEAGVDLSDDNDAVATAKAFAIALGQHQPAIIAKTFMTKKKEYTKKDGTTGVNEPRLAVGDWKELSAEALAEHGIRIW